MSTFPVTAVNLLINLCRRSVLPEVPLHPCLGAGLLLLLEETKSTRGFKNLSLGTNGNDLRAAVLGSVSLGGRRGKSAFLSLTAWFALHRDSLVPDVKTLCTNLRFPLNREKSRKLNKAFDSTGRTTDSWGNLGAGEVAFPRKEYCNWLSRDSQP